MQTINEIFKAFGLEYIEFFGKLMPNNHQKVIDAIVSCRTKACGMVVYECTKCGTMHTTFRFCGNRHCPRCQNHKIKLWVEKQMKRCLPVHYFMITDPTFQDRINPYGSAYLANFDRVTICITE